MSDDFQLKVIDSLANHQRTLAEFKKKYLTYRSLKKELMELKEEEQKAQQDLDYYQFQLNELIDAALDEEGEQEVSMGVYPNPAQNTINIDLIIKRDASFEGAFYDPIGQLIKRIDGDYISAGKTTLTVPIEDLPTGTYLLRVKVDDLVIFEKVAKTD